MCNRRTRATITCEQLPACCTCLILLFLSSSRRLFLVHHCPQKKKAKMQLPTEFRASEFGIPNSRTRRHSNIGAGKARSKANHAPPTVVDLDQSKKTWRGGRMRHPLRGPGSLRTSSLRTRRSCPATANSSLSSTAAGQPARSAG